MIVRDFLYWMQKAPANMRADATRDLVEYYLWGNLTSQDKQATVAALVSLLDDRSPLVRLAMAESLARHENSPSIVLSGLARDNAEIAAIVLEHSPLFQDAELIDIIETSGPVIHEAIALRDHLSNDVAISLAEKGNSRLALSLLNRPEFTSISDLSRVILQRFGDQAHVREALGQRVDTSINDRLTLVSKTSDVLTDFVTKAGWLNETRATRVSREMHDGFAISSMRNLERPALIDLVINLQENNKLTPSLLLRGILSGQRNFFDIAVALVTNVELSRVTSLVKERSGRGLYALLNKAGIPESLIPAFDMALQTSGPTMVDGIQLNRIEAVLQEYHGTGVACDPAVLSLLQQFYLEASRAEARTFTSDLLNQQVDTPMFAIEQGAVLGWNEDPEAVHARVELDKVIEYSILEEFKQELAAKSQQNVAAQNFKAPEFKKAA